MSNSDARKAVALAALGENFGKELSAPLLNLWLDLLAVYPAEQVEQAVRLVIESYAYKTMPPFAVLKSALDEIRGESAKALALQAAAEWDLLLRNLALYSRYNPPADLHPTTAWVLELLGGWESACCWQTSTLDYRRREFLQFWVEAHGRAELLYQGASGALAALGAGGGRSGCRKFEMPLLLLKSSN